MIKLKNKNLIYYVVLFLLVVVNVFLFSSASPIHNFYNLQHDQILYDLIGKGIKQGKVPYVDLIDHKGIYLFMTYALANVIGETNHMGLFILKVIVDFVVAIFLFKIAELILSKVNFVSEEKIGLCDNKIFVVKNISLITSFAIVVLLNSYFLTVGGLECEELMFPFILIGFYLFLKHLYSGERKHKLSYIYVYGICAAAILFIKANAILFYGSIAVYLFIDLIRKKEWKNLLLNILFGFIGLVVALLPGILYCIYTGSVSEMIEHTFIVNFKYLGTGFPGTESKFEAFAYTYKSFIVLTMFVIIGVFTFISLLKNSEFDAIENNINENVKNNIKEKIFGSGNDRTMPIFVFYILSLAFSLYATYAACRPYPHYMILLLPYLISPISYFLLKLYDIFGLMINVKKENANEEEKENEKNSKKILLVNKKRILLSTAIVVLLLNILSYGLNLEIALMNGTLQEEIALKTRKVYREYFNTNEKKNFLAVGFVLYLYDALDTLPNESYFATPAVLRSDYSRPYDAILKCIDSGKEDFIVVGKDRIMTMGDAQFINDMYASLNRQYENVGQYKDKVEFFVKKNLKK